MKKIVLVLGFLSMLFGGINAALGHPEELGPEPKPVMVRSTKPPFRKEATSSIQARKAWAQKKAKQDAAANASTHNHSAQPAEQVPVISLQEFTRDAFVDGEDGQQEQPQDPVVSGTPVKMAIDVQTRNEREQTPFVEELVAVNTSQSPDLEAAQTQSAQGEVPAPQVVEQENQTPQDFVSPKQAPYLERYFKNPSSRNITFGDKVAGAGLGLTALAVWVSHEGFKYRVQKQRSIFEGTSFPPDFKTYLKERVRSMTKTEWARALVALAAAGVAGTALHHVFVSSGSASPAA